MIKKRLFQLSSIGLSLVAFSMLQADGLPGMPDQGDWTMPEYSVTVTCLHNDKPFRSYVSDSPENHPNPCPVSHEFPDGSVMTLGLTVEDQMLIELQHSQNLSTFGHKHADINDPDCFFKDDVQ